MRKARDSMSMEEATGISYTAEEKSLCFPFYTDCLNIVGGQGE